MVPYDEQLRRTPPSPPSAPQSPPAVRLPPPPPPARQPRQCELCGGALQPVRVVWEQGTTANRSGTIGAGLAGGHIIPFIAGSGGSNQTLFAQRCAPPERPGSLTLWSIIGTVLIIVVLAALLVGFIRVSDPPRTQSDWAGFAKAIGVACLSCLASVFCWRFHVKERTKDHEAWLVLVGEWNRTWICLNCGKKFTEV
jgi:hypothetical protein